MRSGVNSLAVIGFTAGGGGVVAAAGGSFVVAGDDPWTMLGELHPPSPVAAASPTTVSATRRRRWPTGAGIVGCAGRGRRGTTETGRHGGACPIRNTWTAGDAPPSATGLGLLIWRLT